MELGPGVPSVKLPVDDGSGGIALPHQRSGLPRQRSLVREPLLQAATGQDTGLDFRHPFGKLRTGFNQLPSTRSSRVAKGSGV